MFFCEKVGLEVFFEVKGRDCIALVFFRKIVRLVETFGLWVLGEDASFKFLVRFDGRILYGTGLWLQFILKYFRSLMPCIDVPLSNFPRFHFSQKFLTSTMPDFMVSRKIMRSEIHFRIQDLFA